ncbi:hypothetical protein MMA231_00205 [Asticcacaulis sp. MM231]|uniref:hypothetical protein n=1 Tax=Asticcacaulis sp. MM231 TaxID=3157666 RepID=UPI0032D5B148
MFKQLAITVSILAGLTAFSPAQAGPYTDDLSKCLVNSASSSDQKDLIRWIFAAIALHPDIRSMSIINSDERAAIDKTAASLMVRLLTVDCRTESVAALKYEGEVSLQTSFSLLGQIAAKGIFSSPEVNAGMAGLTANVDADKLNALYKEAGIVQK